MKPFEMKTNKSVLDILHGAAAIRPTLDQAIDNHNWVQATAKAERRPKVDTLLTATLETSLQHLDTLRRDLERTNQKNIGDVRKHAGWGADLLAAIEGTITYYDLVQLINEMRDGIALRRAAAKGLLA